MNWDRVQDLVSHDAQWLDHISFIVDFMTTLFKALQACQSVDECASLYPQAGGVLTMLAVHPSLGRHTLLTSLVIECILEYTKYDFKSSGTVSKASKWCEERLRRIHQTKQEGRVDRLIKLVQTRLQSGSLTISQLTQLGDLAIVLMDEDHGLPVLETLFDAAIQLKQQQGHQHRSCVFSAQFIQHVVQNGCGQWPIRLVTKCFRVIPTVLEIKWMTNIERYVLKQPDVMMQELKDCPDLMDASFGLIANWMTTEWADWRILRLWLCVWDGWNRPVFIDLEWNSVDKVYAGLMAFIYGGSPLDILGRRKKAWLVSMMYPLYTARFIDDWIGWALKEEECSEMMNHLSSYIAWLVCPSLDGRMMAYRDSLNDWIHTFKGFDQIDPLSCSKVTGFLDQWYILTNGHLPVGTSILGSIIHHSPDWTSSQCISMIDRFIDHINLQEVSKASVTIALVERLTIVEDPRMNTLIPHLHSFIPPLN